MPLEKIRQRADRRPTRCRSRPAPAGRRHIDAWGVDTDHRFGAFQALRIAGSVEPLVAGGIGVLLIYALTLDYQLVFRLI